ncbi:hypothetical protein BSL78_25150 [Apostichopus japonicus]|uniref:Uncharacterized protein n=1 Tax=Stichopus japonicus TaxID=307972 RepID=A0A2G8JQI8_STIJA|nr:hypothetical protein BSL78_25150 [Apostichopus japonicus]
MDDSDEISELNDDDLLNKFLSYLRENFDDEEKKLMIQQLLKDGGYQLDEDGDLDIGDFVFQSAPDDTDFGERQLFNDYSPLDHSKKNSVTSRQDKKTHIHKAWRISTIIDVTKTMEPTDDHTKESEEKEIQRRNAKPAERRIFTRKYRKLILPEEEDCIKQYMDNELQRMRPRKSILWFGPRWIHQSC